MTYLKSGYRAFRHEVRAFLGDHPSVFFPIYCMKEANRKLAVSSDTDILIEGFPRSGNTFSVMALAMAQEHSVKIGSHLHVPAHIYRGLKLGVPIMLLIRKPQDAVVSLIMRDPALSFGPVLNYYIKFHESLMPLRNQVFIAKFEEVTENFGHVIEKFNQRFNTSFNPFEHSTDNVEKVFQEIERRNSMKNIKREVKETEISRPSIVRKSLAAQIQHRLNSPEINSLLSQANQVYKSFLYDVQQS